MSNIVADELENEPEEPVSGVQPSSVKGSSGRKSFSKLRRELSDDELVAPAVQRMLIDEIERLELERVDLNKFRQDFHVVDKRAAVLDEKFKSNIALEILSLACTTIGAALWGYAPSIWTAQSTTGIFLAIVGSVLILAGIVAKAIKI